MKRSKKIYDHREVLNDNKEEKKRRAIVLLLPVTMGKFVASRITQLNVEEKNQENVEVKRRKSFYCRSEESRINFRR